MAGLASALAFVLLHSLWQGALLAFVAALILRAMARASAASRHVVAMCFLIALVVVPAAQFAIYANADAPLAPGPLVNLFGAQPLAAPFMVVAWAAGIAFMLARRSAGRAAIVAMERAGYSEVPRAWFERVGQIRQTLGIAASVAMRVSETLLTPCVTGGLRPVVWLPVALLTRIPVEQLEALLAHELAHIARRDWLWNGLQNAIETLLFYHPAVWWLSRRVRQEREHACDDLAVAACGDALALAEGLAGLAEARQRTASFSLAANGGALLQRVTRLLSEAPSPTRGRVRAILSAVVIACALVVGQVGIGGGQPLDLVVESSTSGPLGAGDYRQITANEGGTERVYRASVDGRGRLSEVYRVNGRVCPIDPTVRRWLHDILH